MSTDTMMADFHALLGSDIWKVLAFRDSQFSTPEHGVFRTIHIEEDHDSDDFNVVHVAVTEFPDGRLVQWASLFEKVPHYGGSLDQVDKNYSIREVEKKTRIIEEVYFESKK